MRLGAPGFQTRGLLSASTPHSPGPPLSSCSYVTQQDLGVSPARDTHPSLVSRVLWGLTTPTCVTDPQSPAPLGGQT